MAANKKNVYKVSRINEVRLEKSKANTYPTSNYSISQFTHFVNLTIKFIPLQMEVAEQVVHQ